VAGTVATVVSLELRLTVSPPFGATDEIVSVIFCALLPLRLKTWGENTAPTVTERVEVADVRPAPVAVITAVPRLSPVTIGWVGGAVWPAEITTEAVDNATRLGSLLTRLIVTSAGAGEFSETGNGVVWPRPSAPFGGRVMTPPVATVTVVLALLIPGAAAAAVSVEVPGATPVTGTLTLDAPPGMNTLPGTVAAAVLLEVRFTVSPPAGVGEDRFSAMFCVIKPLMVTACDWNAMVVVT
jgi:hypothetical protein